MWRSRGRDQQQIDVAPVVVVGRDDGEDGRGEGEPGLGGDVGEAARAVVAQQACGRRTGRSARHEQIEVAVVIRVEPRCGARVVRERAQLRGSRDVGEPGGRIAVKKRDAAGPEHRQIGVTVVVVVAREHRRGRAARGAAEQVRRDVGETSAAVPEQAHACCAAFDEIEIAVAVEIERRDAAGIAIACAGRASGWQGRGRIRERDVGNPCVDQLGLGSGRGDGFGVAALREVGLGVGDGVGALAEALKMRHRGAAFVCPAAEDERVREAVGSRCVVRRRLHRAAKGVDRFLIFAFLSVKLPEIDRDAGVSRIETRGARECVNRLLGPPGTARDESEQVVGMRPVGKIGPSRGDFARGAFGVAAVKKSDAQIQTGDGQPWI